MPILDPDEVGALARNVRRYRRAMGLRPAELADWVGVSAVYLTAIELGAIGRPDDDVLKGLARLMDLDDWRGLLAPQPAPSVPTAERRSDHTPTASAAQEFLRQQQRSASGQR